MSLQMALAPVFVLVLLNFLLLIAMGRVRGAAIRSKQVRIGDSALGQDAWPAKATQVANAFSNQFEMSVLFYALVAIALPLRHMTLLMVLLAWVFVVTRYAHAYIYSTSNNINQRFSAFFAGVIVLLIMWVYLAIRVMLPGVLPI